MPTATKKPKSKTITIDRYTLLTVPEAADILGVSRWTVYRLIKDGSLPTRTISGITKIHPVELADFAKRTVGRVS